MKISHMETMWCPYGKHMCPCQNHMETTCCLHANHVVYTWEPCGVYMVTTLCQHKNHMVSTCHMFSTWTLYYVVSMWTQHS